MEHVILGLLMMGPSTIYLLRKQFSGNISLFYSNSPGGLQRALRMLLEKEYIECREVMEKGRRKKIYTITVAGQQNFMDWMAAPIEGRAVEDIALARVYFLGLLPDTGQRKAVVDVVLQRISQDSRTLESWYGELQKKEIPPSYHDVFSYQVATLAYAVSAHKHALEWFFSLKDSLEP